MGNFTFENKIRNLHKVRQITFQTKHDKCDVPFPQILIIYH